MAAALICGCSSTKRVPAGQLLLDNVRIRVDNDSVHVAELYNFLRQTPNHKVFGFAKLQLATYNIAGADTSKWYNRWLKSVGQPPVIYDSVLTRKSGEQLRQALVNRGYMDVDIEVIEEADSAGKRIDVDYVITTGVPHIISSIDYNIPDGKVARLLRSDSILSMIRPGQLFDRNRLDQFRTDVTNVLRNNGYYTFNKDYITFVADTARGSKDVALTMNIRPAVVLSDTGSATDSLRYAPSYIRKVVFVTNYNPRDFDGAYGFEGATDTVDYKGISVIYGTDRYIKPSILQEKCFIEAGKPYSASAVERTYEALGQLGILKFINIAMRPVADIDGSEWLDAYVMISRNKKQSIILDLEGTNSEGDLGFGLGVTYQHRNLAKGSELLSAKFRTSYESLSGNFNGLINNRYTEYAGEVGITFPKFMFPLLSPSLTKRLRPSTEFAVSANYQERPEYTRIIAGAAWKYKWTRNRRDLAVRHTFDLIDANYVKLPKSTLNFLDSIAPQNPLLRYSYEDHFIMRMGYTFSCTNKRTPSAAVNAFAI